MDNPVSWLLLVIGNTIFLIYFFKKVIHDFEARQREAEEFWENYYK